MTVPPLPRRRAAALSVLIAAACGPAPRPAPPPLPAEIPGVPSDAPAPEELAPREPATAAEPAPDPLPPIPRVTGPLALRVTYPTPDQRLTARDSNFIFGSTGTGDATLTINGAPVRVHPNGAFLAFLPVPADGRYTLVARRGADTAARVLTVRVPGAPEPRPAGPPPAPPFTAPRLVRVNARGAVNDTDRVVPGRPVAGGTYKWFFLPHTAVVAESVTASTATVVLDGDLRAVVPVGDVTPVDGDPRPPLRVVGNLRVASHAGYVDVRFPLAEPPPYLVEQDGDALVLTLYGTRANTDIIAYPTSDTLVRHVSWTQETAARARYVIHLAQRPFGYQVFHDRGTLVLRVRRPPTVADRGRPLRGLTIAVDPGHPPAGSTGPTGLYEGEAVLPIALLLKDLLEDRGAYVVITRTTNDPLGLEARTTLARRADAHALVSVHLNAFPDGVNPLTSTAVGTGTYWFHPHSEPLAREVQRGMVRRMGLRDVGVFYDNLALVRPTWMPAVLTEGAFLMIPEHEAALRTPAFQRRYAQGIVDGLERYFARFADRP